MATAIATRRPTPATVKVAPRRVQGVLISTLRAGLDESRATAEKYLRQAGLSA